MSIFKKGGQPGSIDLTAIPRFNSLARDPKTESLPAIRPPNAGGQTDRPAASSPRPPAGSLTDRPGARPGTGAGGAGAGRGRGVPVRREGLDKLEEKWKNRKPPRRQGEAVLNNDDTPQGQIAFLRDLLADLPDNSKREEAMRLLEMLGGPTPESPSRPVTQGSMRRVLSGTSGEDEMEREMAALQKLLEANDVDAAEEKLQKIITDAEADGHIDEDEQKQIDDAKSELEAMRQRRAEAEKVVEEARQKADLIALMAANDVEAAEKKLKEIIAAALEDGNIDDDEQRAIDEATRDLEKLKARKAAMDRKNARLKQATIATYVA